MSDISVLWENSTAENDRKLLTSIASEVVAGDEAYQAQCVDKILTHISDESWQKKYTHRNFVFCIYYMRGFRIIELNLAMATQAVDALYFLMSNDVKERSLAKKVSYVFETVYGHKMPGVTAETVRILRNNVMHTGAIFGIPAARSASDTQILKSFCKKYQPTNQIMTEEQILVGLAGSFGYLMRELVVRVLGLKWNDLLQNGNPPSKLAYFCKPIDRLVFKDMR